MSTKIDVVKFTFRKEWRALNEAVTGKYASEEFSAAADLVTYVATQPACLIFASLSEKDDLIQLATFVKLSKKTAKDTIMKIVVVNFAGNKQFEKAIAKLGILDVVDPYINTKALRFKIDFYMKSLHGQIKNSGKSDMNVKSMDQNNKQEEKKRTDAANWLAPLDCEDDIWLLKKEADCKKVLGRWLVRFMGPSPAAGQWNEVKGKSNAWKFEFKPDSAENFVSGKGTWYFQGDQKPDFVWKENSWLITGSSFELFYHEDGKKISRAKLKDKILEICKNSEYAKTKEQAILDSCNKELVFKKEADLLNDKEGVEGEGTDWLKDLHGKGSTDHLDTDPLEGKNDSSLDQLNSNPMSLDLDHGENNLGDGKMSGKGSAAGDLGGNYDGESSTDKIDKKGQKGPGGVTAANSDPFDLDLDSQDHKTKYKGHNEAEEFGKKDDLLATSGNKHKDGALLDMKNGNQDHQTKYKGHNEAEVFEEGEVGKNQYQEESKGPLGGKSNTDHIPKFYNKDGSKPDRALTPEEKAESDAYEGKGKTDKIASHYGRGADKAQSEAKDSKDKERSQKESKSANSSDEPDFDDEIGTEALAGSSSTDKIKSHYGGKKDSAQSDFDDSDEDMDSKAVKERKARAMSGAGETEKIDSHYGSGNRNKSNNKVSEDDLFEDNDDFGGEEKSSANTKSAARRKSENDDDQDSEDIFSKPKSRKESVEDESDSDDFFARKKKPTEDTDSDSQDIFEKESRNKNRNVKPDSDSSDTDDDMSEEGGEVISIARARDSKNKKKAPAPLVSEKDIDKDLKTMMEEATITAVLTQNKTEISCVLDDFFEKTLIFISNQPGMNSHDPIILDMKFKYMQKVTSLKFDGRVVSIDIMDGSMSYLTVELAEDKVQAFSSFMQLFQQRQSNIDAFLKRAKGE